ncbi:MAG: hypothetical protein PHU23_15650 [Dehalococcoidales bacterium]|nr:hypothetical protein [Dehalococcoidales bacterium]
MFLVDLQNLSIRSNYLGSQQIFVKPEKGIIRVLQAVVGGAVQYELELLDLASE